MATQRAVHTTTPKEFKSCIIVGEGNALSEASLVVAARFTGAPGMLRTTSCCLPEIRWEVVTMPSNDKFGAASRSVLKLGLQYGRCMVFCRKSYSQ